MNTAGDSAGEQRRASYTRKASSILAPATILAAALVAACQGLDRWYVEVTGAESESRGGSQLDTTALTLGVSGPIGAAPVRIVERIVHQSVNDAGDAASEPAPLLPSEQSDDEDDGGDGEKDYTAEIWTGATMLATGAAAGIVEALRRRRKPQPEPEEPG